MNPLIQFKRATALFLVVLGLACFRLSPLAQAVSPPPDGDYANGNTAEGINALFGLTTGIANTAIGANVMWFGGTGSFNTAIGAVALVSNTSSFNTAVGAAALRANDTGSDNTATGLLALLSNTSGGNNTAVGSRALLSNIAGNNNTAMGFQALNANTTDFNTAVGFQALFSNDTGSENTAVGIEALLENTDGSNNTAVGAGALFHNKGSFNIGIGNNSGEELTTGTENIDIGNAGLAGESDTIRIGNATHAKTFIGGIRGTTTTLMNAIPVVIDGAGQLGTASSSERFKKDIAPMDKASEAILALKPVTFHYKQDTKGIAQFGLIAEDVAKVNPDLVVRDKNDEIYTVRYDAVNAMLLNEFLKEHRKVEEQQATIAQLKQDFQSKFAEQQKQIKALTSGLEKVNNQLELSKPAPQTVLNNQ